MLFKLLGSFFIMYKDLKMGLANFVPTIIINITGVGTALNMEQPAGLGVQELYSHQGINVTILVSVRIIFAVESCGLGEVFQITHSLSIRRILAVTVNPDLVQIIASQLLLRNPGLDIGGDLAGHGVRVVVIVMDKVVDLVELEEDAGLALVIPVVALAAGTKLSKIEVANLEYGKIKFIICHLIT